MTEHSWRLILDGPCDGEFNMARDEALLHSCERGEKGPVLRLYAWQRPTLSIGYAQDPARDLDIERCKDEGIPIVRRPTGGRALLHVCELTYAVVAPLDHPQLGGRLRDTLAAVSELLCLGLERLGVSGVQFASGKGPGSPGNRSAACFLSLNHGEITVGGKKLVGSAQRRLKRAFLQHGSILLDEGGERFADLCQANSEAERRIHNERLRHSMTHLRETCGRSVGFDEAAREIARAFQEELKGTWVPESPHPANARLQV